MQWSRLARGVCGVDCERNGSCCFLFAGAASQTVAFKFDAVSVVNDAAQYCVTESWIRDNVVPLRHGHSTCDQQRSLIVAIIDDFEQIAALVGGERLGSPVVNDNESAFGLLDPEARNVLMTQG